MRFLLLTPGTGSYYCGSCLRDDALARALRAAGHAVQQVPLYLPFVLEGDVEEEPRVHMGGVNLYLRHKAPLLRRTPRWIANLLDHPDLLRWASTFDGMTDSVGLGEMTLSMLRGEEGRQAPELDELAAWLAKEPPADVVLLSNAMLSGMARRLKAALNLPVVCTLQGEAPFLDTLPEPFRSQAWAELATRAADVDLFIPVSRYYGELMRDRLGLARERMAVVHNGIDPAGITPPATPPEPPAVGYLARLCRDKGLHTLVDAWLILKERGSVPGLRLKAAGVQLAADRELVEELKQRVARAGHADDFELRPNVPREEKLELLRSIRVLSVPATYGESFGLYLLEAMAASVPVVQPRHGAFPEILAATSGGVLCEPDDPRSLADALEGLLLDPERARTLGARGRAAVLERFTVAAMARGVADACAQLAATA